ncbi:MAG TPA: hypothetical protein VEI07_00830 [Planctomycetaceae bacterium]|nr:hypothetical protein [Planctomycetaceae bacterium]
MNNLSSRQRKLIYLVVIILLVIPIIWLGRPTSGTGSEMDQGKLAQLRVRYDLGENQMGQVDPTSAAMNLVLLGFRGIAADLLWAQADENEQTKNWAELRANVDAIILLQPHFVRVWQFQGWNLAYNVSAAWDLVADRFYWVKEGAKFLKKGRAINEKIAQLPYEEGRVLGTKIGRADEWKFYRAFFKKDPNEELFKGGADPELNPKGTDNYLAAKDVYLVANDLQQKYPQSVSMLDVLFRSYPYRSQINYADALQREGHFDESSQTAWEESYREWVEKFGQEKFYGPAGSYHLEMTERDMQEAAEGQNADVDEYTRWVLRMQNETRYPYWKFRSQAESAKLMVDAHRLIYDGERQFVKGNLSTARDLLFRGMTLYEQLFSKYQVLATDDEALEEAITAVYYWQRILKLEFKPIQAQYPLSVVYANHANLLPQIESRFKRETGQD